MKLKFRLAGQCRSGFAITSIIVFLLISCLGLACGKVGAPVPPARFLERTAELSAIQQGNIIVLSWPPPALGQSESSRFYIARADIYRLEEIRSEEPVLDPEDYEDSAQVVGYLDRAAIESQVKSLGRLQFKDVLNLTQTNNLSDVRLRYAVRYVNKREQTAPFSNTVALEPAPAVALPPTELRAATPRQDEILLTWRPPGANVDGTSPASIVGYNLYRRGGESEFAGKPLNSDVITDTSFTDKEFEYLEDYVYVVRALSQGANGLIESADSSPVPIKPVDTFAPSAPDPVSIASANVTISIFWPTNPEPDVSGYNVYRADSKDAPPQDWIKLNAQPVTATTFHDDKVVQDRSYAYRVTAVDRFKNESAPSRVVSQTAHP